MDNSRGTKRKRRRWELAAVALFVLANLAVPLVVEDLFPFTTTPMFRDKPRYYSNYVVYAVRGEKVRPLAAGELQAALSALELQRFYDGNPAGLGVGQMPPATLDRFSDTLAEQPGEAEVRRHVEERLSRLSGMDVIELEREIFGPLDNGKVGKVQSARWRIERPAEHSSGDSR